ncbi:MAG: hypothetical protein AMJ90_04810 [candidate division Zixibacteria bacterium SM23_73_2]|nr:MAG: hypothetical protein AMJ90_04810 [candidate division Zixibacteria bacterium SM23_73_2]
MKRKKIKAVALFSGGLDSILAVKLIMEMGVEVCCLFFKTPFFPNNDKEESYIEKLAEKNDIKFKKVFLGTEYMEMIKKPKFGYGKNYNPCIDCRILMLKEAKRIMEKGNFDFVFTGEVLGERPMSQHRDSLSIIERASGLKGKLLRPLSAKHFEPTIPEERGWVERLKLLDIKGRSRKPQLFFAEKFKIKDFLSPSGGCLLTDQNFTRRLKDSLEHREDSLREIQLLKIGRHFRLPSGAKVIAGRNEEENARILALGTPEETKLTAVGYKSTYVLLLGDPDSFNLKLASGICARYCDKSGLDAVPIGLWTESEKHRKIINSKALKEVFLKKYML